MKYNRPTKRIANDEEAFLFHSSLHEGIERLAELEDKIERGELVPAAEYESARHHAEVVERALIIMAERVLEYAEKAKVMAMMSDGLFSCDKNTQIALLANDALRKAEARLKEIQGGER